MRREKRAFTLVELVIVLVILAILVGVALPAFTGARAKAYRAEALSQMGEIKSMAWCLNLQYGNATFAGWFGLRDGVTDGQENRTKAIGYSSSDWPQTNNYKFYIGAYYGSVLDTINVSYPGDCSPMPLHGACFLIYAQTKLGSPAYNAGATSVALVMNYTGATVISFPQGRPW